ncbi:hypothetical protein DERP_001605 [Dermatophagoides pteronyssinus]|uniref:Uncharacterized protein n=1 Tax=Dermatophagoides pteronyssinus TaxID=6956 RepID=A0ABQ8JAZ8_DERPT|nr:hypothetical protein DERP_001605 [Dermatophagoides pteronyssinus]
MINSIFSIFEHWIQLNQGWIQLIIHACKLDFLDHNNDHNLPVLDFWAEKKIESYNIMIMIIIELVDLYKKNMDNEDEI